MAQKEAVLWSLGLKLTCHSPEEIAIDNLEQCNFYLALHSGVWKFLPGRPPSVHVSAHEDMGLDAAPFQWVPDKEVMQTWLEI
ncbi:unnamed protein product, partial [Symbiodinium microadriaticum]